jgi:hypothetical protein
MNIRKGGICGIDTNQPKAANYILCDTWWAQVGRTIGFDQDASDSDLLPEMRL